MSILEREQWTGTGIDDVFAFFSDPRNLERITPPWVRFVLLDPPAALRVGTLLDYRLRIRGIPVRWQSEITVWEPPNRFVDTQTRGPCRAWIHEHRFEPAGGGVLMRDLVRYAVPGGRLVDKLLVRPDLERIFDYRKVKLKEILDPSGSEGAV
jgi:ligand-binding SRPBCC domain-containing protein